MRLLGTFAISTVTVFPFNFQESIRTESSSMRKRRNRNERQTNIRTHLNLWFVVYFVDVQFVCIICTENHGSFIYHNQHGVIYFELMYFYLFIIFDHDNVTHIDKRNVDLNSTYEWRVTNITDLNMSLSTYFHYLHSVFYYLLRFPCTIFYCGTTFSIIFCSIVLFRCIESYVIFEKYSCDIFENYVEI